MAFSVASAALAENWPAWRGPQGTGVANETTAPLEWSSSKNVKWKAALPAPGNAHTHRLWQHRQNPQWVGSGVLIGDHLYILNAVSEGTILNTSKSQVQPVEIQLPHLETFSKAAEHCNFTAAGRTLGMTQAAVSQRIHALETVLGKPLFSRKGTRILLTEAGQQLYEYARQILTLHREAFETITGQSISVMGELLLAASSVPGEQLLPEILSEFRKQFPRIRVRATILDSLAVIHEIEHGNVHLGLVGRKSESPHLEYRPVAADEMVLVLPADHPWRRRRAVSLAQLAREPLVLREPGSGSRWCFEQALAAGGKSLNDMHVTLELGSNEAIKEAVLQGMGVTILSALAVQREVAAGQLHALRISSVSLERTMYAVWDVRRALPAPARMLLHFLESRQHAATQRTGGS